MRTPLAITGLSIALLGLIHKHTVGKHSNIPIVINTWGFVNATAAGFAALSYPGGSVVDAVVAAASRCEVDQCDRTVGYGGSPDESGHTTLDALVMDGDSMRAGAVSNLQHIKNAILAARLVMDHTMHTQLAGSQATQFAIDMGLKPENLTTDESAEIHQNWLEKSCQPNFWHTVVPDPHTSCGPYTPVTRSPRLSTTAFRGSWVSEVAHDTIAVAALDEKGSLASGCSSNGACHKVAGRVGDCSTPGAGAYADSEVGACGSTGDGDIHLRFLPCYLVVENMRMGLSPTAAAEDAIRRIAKRVPGYVGAVFALDMKGKHGAACHGWNFRYSYQSARSEGVRVVEIEPIII